MIVELAAVRLLAPWFGSSSAVWTNVIGVVLLALAVGYLVGAQLAEGAKPLLKLGSILIAAGIFTLWLPALAAPVAEFLVPRGISLAESPELFTWGSLAGAFLLFAPAAAMLGCVGPLATEILQRRGVAHAGSAGGRVLFASTVGSLVGTFATTYYLIPRLGLSATFLGAGALVLFSGVLLVLRARKGLSALAILIAVPALPFSRVQLPEASDGYVTLASTESSYQFLRVVESEDLEAPHRFLQVNEGLDSFQSVWTPTPGLLGAGYYYDYFALPTWWRRVSAPRVFVVGLGAGTTWRVLDGAAPPDSQVHLIGAEIDSAVVEYGHDHFGLPRSDERLQVLAGWDGRAGLNALNEPCDLIILDAYANQTEIPAHLSSLEFLQEVRANLVDGGYLAINIGGFGFQDPVVQAIARTAASAFEERVLLLQIPHSRNVMLYAVRGSEPPDLSDEPVGMPPEIAALIEAVRLPGCYQWIEGSGTSLTDDLNPLDRLQSDSLARGIESWIQ